MFLLKGWDTFQRFMEEDLIFSLTWVSMHTGADDCWGMYTIKLI